MISLLGTGYMRLYFFLASLKVILIAEACLSAFKRAVAFLFDKIAVKEFPVSAYQRSAVSASLKVTSYLNLEIFTVKLCDLARHIRILVKLFVDVIYELGI